MRTFLAIIVVLFVIGLMVVVVDVATVGVNANVSPHVVKTEGAATASIDETEVDLGLFDPNVKREQSFFIKNTGDDVLRLHKGGHSCSCTTSEIRKTALSPGETTEVIVSWSGKKWSGEFWQYAAVRTNDPQHREMKLVVRGQVLAKLAADKQDLDFGSMAPDQTPQGELLVYSHVWDELKIEAITSSWKGAAWKVEPADTEDLLPHRAKSGSRILITGPQLAGGQRLSEWLRIKASPPAVSSNSQELEINVIGSTRQYFSIYGKHTKRDGVLDFGRIKQGDELVSQSFIQVHGEHTNLTFEKVKVEPSFVQAHISKHETDDGKKGWYRLVVTIPSDAPIASHRLSNHGTITIRSNHPKEPELTLRLDFEIRK